MARRLAIALLAALSLVALSVPALAKQGAVTKFDSLPTDFHAGQVYSLGYLIKMDGVEPYKADRTEIGIYFAKTKPKKLLRILPLINTTFTKRSPSNTYRVVSVTSTSFSSHCSRPSQLVFTKSFTTLASWRSTAVSSRPGSLCSTAPPLSPRRTDFARWACGSTARQ